MNLILCILQVEHLAVSVALSMGRGYPGWLSTYYIYDDLNQLRAVIQPKGVELLIQNSWNINALNGDILNEQTFRYEYDQRGRMVNKKVPGAAEVWMVYDAGDRLVMTQDGNMRNTYKWLCTTYDVLNRPLTTGMITDNNSLSYHLDQAYNSTAYPNTGAYSYDVLTETHYDDYNNIPGGLSAGLDNTYITASNFITSYNTSPDYAEPVSASTKTVGMVTWMKVKVLNSSQYLYSVNIYDDKARVIQVKSINLTGGTDIVTTQYDFAGKVLRTHLKQQNTQASDQGSVVELKGRNTYDDLGRIIKIEKQINNVGWKAISTMTYDALGQAKTKKLGPDYNNGAGLETLTYDYNIRGWLLGVNKNYIGSNSATSNYFGMELNYDKDGYTATANKQFNGNIGSSVWRSQGDGIQRKYDYDYDAANRLLKADFIQQEGGGWSNANVNFSVKMGDGTVQGNAYDANGNIKRMQQWGLKVGSSSPIDDLNYSYFNNGNKLQAVVDGVVADQKLGDFTDKNTSSVDYGYDRNGNLITDLNKRINGSTGLDQISGGAITYNHLNLPELIIVKDDNGVTKGRIFYLYDALGTKLQKRVVDFSTYNVYREKVTNYIGGFVYEQETQDGGMSDGGAKLQFVSHEEGRIRFKSVIGTTPDSFSFDYFIKDHLGNVRMVLTDEQQTNAYPAASLETATLSSEKTYYTIPDAARTDKATIWNYPTNDAYTNPNQWIQKLKGDATKIGTSIALKVMAGDKINIRASSWWTNNSVQANPTNIVNALNDVVNALITGVPAASGSKIVSGQLTSTVLNPSVTDLLNYRNTNNYVSSKPKAYVNWILLDEQFRPVLTNDGRNSGFEQVGADNEFKVHTKTGIELTRNGYLYIYLSNESTDINVFFDNLQVTHIRGQLLEETHYYPFGLTMAGISSQAAGSLENKRKFNKGSELQSKEFSDGSGLELYATNFRSLDPQLGRWWQIDPKASESESPYASMSNNPIRFNDPLGDTIVDAQIRGDKNWSKAYNTFLNSRAGKRFVKLYSPGGKFGKTTVEFKVGGTSNSGKTTAFSIDRKDGSATKLDPDKKYDGIDKVAKGESKSSYLKFEVNLRAGEDMSNSVEQVEGGETILHETQHVGIDQQTLITDKAINNPFYQHRDWMKPTNSGFYQERAGFYIENRQMWQADYERQKAQGKAKSESDYIQKKVNDFFN